MKTAFPHNKNYRATGHAPYGYRWRGRPAQLVEHEDEQRVLRIILEMRDGGHSALETAEHLNEKGLPPRFAEFWTPGTIQQILHRWRGKSVGETA